MKLKFLFLVGLFYSSVNAQSHYAGQYSIGLNYGFVPNGTNYNLNIQKIIGNKFFGVRTDIDLLEQNYKMTFYDDDSYKGVFKSQKIGIGATYSLEKLLPHPFYLQLYIGGIYSNEKLKDFDINSNAMPNYNKNNFGMYFGSDLELVIFPALSIVGGVKYQNVFNSNIDKELVFGQVGLKLNL